MSEKECVTKCDTCEAQGHEERAEDRDDSCERDPHLRLDQLNLSVNRKALISSQFLSHILK